MGLREIVKAANDHPQIFRQELSARIDKIHAENLKLNAFLRTYFSAEALPRMADKIIARKKGLPLFGALFAAKDNFQVKHQPLTFGLLPPLAGPSLQHAAIIELLIKKGATLAGSTNLDPAGLNCTGDNPYYGRVTNPRFRDRIAAGSSAGSAAVVAAELCDFALGTDFGGSVRAPAAACGVYGLKSSPDFWPRQGVILLNTSMDCLGFVTGSLADLIYLHECLLPEEQRRDAPVRPQFIVPPWDELDQLEAETHADFSFVLERLKRAWTVQQLDFKIGFEQSLEVRKSVAASDFQALSREHGLNPEALPDAARAVLMYERILTPLQKEMAQDQAKALRVKLSAMLDASSFIITPALPAQPPSWSTLPCGRDALPSRRLNRFLALANVCGLPALSMPLEDTLSKFPFSLQIVGPPGGDWQILKCAELIKEAVWQAR